MAPTTSTPAVSAQQMLLNKYSILSQLGQGSFARVYLAKNKSSGASFAVKHVQKSSDPQKNVCLKYEKQTFKILSAFPHTNIVRCYESFEDDAEIFFVQEYLPHGDLPSFLRNVSSPSASTSLHLDEELMKRIAWGLVKGLNHLHSIGLVHRDLKLENICIGSDWEPKIIDFNFTTRWSSESLLRDPFGTPVYCCPEIFHGKAYRGPEVDIWSLGVLLFALLFNAFPFASTIPKDGERALSNSEKIQQIGWKVVKGDFTFPFPGEKSGAESPLLPQIETVGEQAKQLICYILQLDGSRRPTINQIMDHVWFKNLRTEELSRKQATQSPRIQYSGSAPLLPSAIDSIPSPRVNKQKDDFSPRKVSFMYRMLKSIF